MVLAGEVRGRWSQETQAFLRQLAKAKARSEAGPQQARAAWVLRWRTWHEAALCFRYRVWYLCDATTVSGVCVKNGKAHSRGGRGNDR